jgi:hypothetical protein
MMEAGKRGSGDAPAIWRCHSERSEESLRPSRVIKEILRYAQDDVFSFPASQLPRRAGGAYA